MKHYILDLESVRLSDEALFYIMPEELKNPQMPRDIANPEGPDLSKCPAYGGDMDKQSVWIKKTLRESGEKADSRKSDWTLAAMEARQKWMGEAALHAPRAQLKILGLRDVEMKMTMLYLIDVTEEEIKKIEAVQAWPCQVQFEYLTEVEALNAFHEFVRTQIGRKGLGQEIGSNAIEPGILVGFWLRHFDFRFLLRRSMILGAKVCRKLVKSAQYFDESLFSDISDYYLLGERELKIGGLDGLAAILGVKRKIGDGEGFGNLWKNDPVAALMYHLNELDTIEQVARRVGAI